MNFLRKIGSGIVSIKNKVMDIYWLFRSDRPFSVKLVLEKFHIAGLLVCRAGYIVYENVRNLAVKGYNKVRFEKKPELAMAE